MKKEPKIVVFKLKELIYTGIFVVLGILLIIFIVNMFSSDSKDTSASSGELPAAASMLPESSPDADENTDSSANSNTNTDADTSSNTDTDANTNSNTDTSTDSDENTPVDASMSASTSPEYNPGVYTSSLVLNNCSLEVQVCVDSNHINSVSVKTLDESVSAMYPLIEGSINDLSNQIVNSQSLANISYTEDCRYTYLILLDAIQSALSKAYI